MKLKTKLNNDNDVIIGHGLGSTKWKGCCSFCNLFKFFNLFNFNIDFNKFKKN
jgi:hypothetical protein